MNPLDPALFRPEAISDETRQFNEMIVKLLTPMPDWWVVGAQATRDAVRAVKARFRSLRNRRGRAPSRLTERAARLLCASSRRKTRRAFISTSTAEAWFSVRRTCSTPCSSA